MPTFDLTHELDPDDEQVHSATPSWVLCVVRFQQIATFSRNNLASVSTDGSQAAAEKGDPLIIAADCTQLVVNTNKRSHISNLSATLKSGEIDYESEMLPGDWLFAWMCETEEKAADIVDRIKNRKACNKFDDGLKFVGRVYSCFETGDQNPEDGHRTVGYDLVGVGFKEFESGVYFNPYLAVAQPFVNTWMGNMGIAVDKFLSKDGIDVNLALPELIELFFGRGISQKAANPAQEDSLEGVTGLTTGDGEAPFSYVVPATVGTLLGRTSRSKSSGVLAYADLLQSYVGIQKYSGANDQVSGLIPSQLKPMLGKFLPQIASFSGRPVWAILTDYLNPSINEMYTCLRANEDGNVVPTFVARQLPLTSSIMASDDRTSFLELPRWKIPDSMILKYRIGRSDALRCNFIKMNGIAPAQAQPDIFTFQDVRQGGAIRDDQDIRRSGLHPDIQMINCGIKDQQTGPEEWNKVRADFMMGMHLTLNGTIHMHGIEAPICEGDNFEWRHTVYHIESITHTAGIVERQKKFMTTLQLSYGVRSDSEGTPAPPPTAFGDDKIYMLLTPDDGLELKPGLGGAGNDTVEVNRSPTGVGAGDFFDQSGGLA